MLIDKEREEKIRQVTTAIEQRSGMDLNIWREVIDRIEKTRRNKKGNTVCHHKLTITYPEEGRVNFSEK